MHRLTVAILAAVDAAIAAAVGLAATLAPLTLLWIFALGGAADWATIWPATGAIWQLGHAVPLSISLPAEYLSATGIDEAAASFSLSLAPLAFAGFTAIFAARSGVRASHAESWVTGVAGGTVVFAALAALVALSTANDVAATEPWQAVLLPTAVFALPALLAAIVTEWREARSGGIARLRDRVEADRDGWGEVPALAFRGAAVALVGMLGLGAHHILAGTDHLLFLFSLLLMAPLVAVAGRWQRHRRPMLKSLLLAPASSATPRIWQPRSPG